MASFSKIKMATENIARKQAAVEYLQENAIPKSLENLLNNVVDACPDDLYGYMELSSFSAPIDIKPAAEAKPLPVKGRTPVPVSESKPRISSDSEQGMASSNDGDDEVHCLINNVNNEIKPALIGCKLYDQREIDGVLQNIITTRAQAKITAKQNEAPAVAEHQPTHDENIPNDEHAPNEPDASSLVSHLDTLTVSLAVAVSASKLAKRPLYRYLCETINTKGASSCRCLPTPMMAVLSSGRTTPGKLYIVKDVMIYTKQGMPSEPALKQLTKIYQELEVILMQKSPTNILSGTGSFTPNIDRPEQALDLIREAVHAAGFAHDSDVNIVLRCCSSDVYDKDKQKYEISSGSLKLSEELINFYEDLCERYPEIRIIIDPLVSEDSEGRMKLQEKIGDKCFIMNSFQANPHKNFEKHTPGLNIRMQDSATITQFLEQTKTLKDEGKILVIYPNDLGNHEECLVDIAVAAEADFFVLETPVHLEQTSKYNRLLEIERHLLTTNTLSHREQLVPTIFVEPTPEDGENEGDEKQSEETDTT